MNPTYSIIGWATTFETHETRKLRKLFWLPIPTSFEGRGFKRLMQRPDGVEIYGAWLLICEVSAKLPSRGVLAKDGQPLGPADFALFTGAKAEVFERAIGALSDPAEGICWLTPSSPAASRHVGEGRENLPDEKKGSTKQRKEETTSPQPTSAAGVDGHELPLEANGNSNNGLPKMFLNGTTPEQVYDAYPRHVARPAALKAIAKAGQAHPGGLSGLLADVRAYAHCAKVQDLRALGKTYLIPHPATWMNQRRWEDDRKEWEQVSGDAPETEEQTINRLLREGSPA